MWTRLFGWRWIKSRHDNNRRLSAETLHWACGKHAGPKECRSAVAIDSCCAREPTIDGKFNGLDEAAFDQGAVHRQQLHAAQQSARFASRDSGGAGMARRI